MIFKVKGNLAVVFFLLMLGFPNTASAKKIKTPENIYFDSADLQKNTSFQKVLTYEGENIEEAKWQYLIDRVRKSPHQFVRNDEIFTGQKAALHLLWKFTRKGGGINTAIDFIEKIASESSMSGKPYLVKISEKEVYPVHDVMENELRRVEEYLKKEQLQQNFSENVSKTE